ncbi:twin-arginine translocase TatA/TatE family subunit [Bacillus sp. 3255]|uniref:twin-arginine translocase TatA/TatE family subunit n=1 Tax=Bacillus sp. 3255 TaxID=2817904 RepID=UPI00286CE8C7|nr:twin-arginine translocase TatA/TatE family subunit [Bacillus sp. 3255]
MKDMFQNIGFTEILLIAIIALVLFGPQKLPEIGRVLGRTLRDFKKATSELMNDEPRKAPAPVIEQAPSAAVTAQAAVSAPVPVQPEAQPSVEAEPAQAEAKPAVTFVSSAPQAAKAEPDSETVTGAAAVRPAVTFASNAPELPETEAAPVSAPAAAPSAAKSAQSRRLPD